MRFCVPALVCLSCFVAAEDVAPVVDVPPASANAEDALLLDASYAIGRDIGGKIGGVVNEYDLNRDRFMAGLESALADAESEMPAARMQEVLMAFQQMQMQKQQEKAAKEAAEAPQRLAKNAEWLAENAKKEGVVALPSGLQYKVLASGPADGTSPKEGQRVECHYIGTKLDGTVFDSSVQRGQPAQFTVGQLIPGWNQALQLMKPGDKWMLFIPSNLAYGENAPPTIGANQILIFELELLRILN